MSQRVAYIALVLLFAVPCFAVGTYFYYQGRKWAQKKHVLSGNPGYEMAVVFYGLYFAVIALGIISCFV